MHYKSIASAFVATATLALTACGGGGGSTGGAGTGTTPNPPVPAPAPEPTATNFTTFTRDMMMSTESSDSAAPVDVESIEWVFTDDDNETTYDDIIASAS